MTNDTTETADSPRSGVTALVVIDLQNGTLANPTAHPATEIVARSVQLVTAFRERGLPVVLARVDGTPPGRTAYGEGARVFPEPWSQLVPELDAHDGDITLARRTWSAFGGTDLHATLQARGVSRVVLAGVATSFGVESTARQAYDLGYSVTVVHDAVTDPDPERHEHTIDRVVPALGTAVSTAELLDTLRT